MCQPHDNKFRFLGTENRDIRQGSNVGINLGKQEIIIEKEDNIFKSFFVTRL